MPADANDFRVGALYCKCCMIWVLYSHGFDPSLKRLWSLRLFEKKLLYSLGGSEFLEWQVFSISRNKCECLKKQGNIKMKFLELKCVFSYISNFWLHFSIWQLRQLVATIVCLIGGINRKTGPQSKQTSDQFAAKLHRKLFGRWVKSVAK